MPLHLPGLRLQMSSRPVFYTPWGSSLGSHAVSEPCRLQEQNIKPCRTVFAEVSISIGMTWGGRKCRLRKVTTSYKSQACEDRILLAWGTESLDLGHFLGGACEQRGRGLGSGQWRRCSRRPRLCIILSSSVQAPPQGHS